MINMEIRQEGLEEILKALLAVPDAFDSGMRQAAQTLRTRAEGNTPESNKPSRGRAKRSWGQIERHSWGYSFENPLHYTTILEEGLYERVGPRTVEEGGQIYSRQAIGGILGPLLRDQTVLERVAALIAAEIIRGINRHA
jgi:hypothetical protein